MDGADGADGSDGSDSGGGGGGSAGDGGSAGNNVMLTNAANGQDGQDGMDGQDGTFGSYLLTSAAPHELMSYSLYHGDVIMSQTGTHHPVNPCDCQIHEACYCSRHHHVVALKPGFVYMYSATAYVIALKGLMHLLMQYPHCRYCSCVNFSFYFCYTYSLLGGTGGIIVDDISDPDTQGVVPMPSPKTCTLSP